MPTLRIGLAALCLSLSLTLPAGAQDQPDGPPAIDAVAFDPPSEILDALGGRTYDVAYVDGVINDASRERDIAFRWRFPLAFEGEAPLIIISHGGYGSERGYRAYPHLGSTYARFGFITLSINHLRSANVQLHRYDRAVDVSFVIDALTAAFWPGGGPDISLDAPEEFGGTIDIHRIGHTGHSFGGFTAHAVGGADFAPTLGITNFGDRRVRAIVPISPQGTDRFGSYDYGPEDNSWSRITIPSYLLAGGDEGPDWRRQPFDRYPAVGDKFLTIGFEQDHGEMGNAGADPVRQLIAWNTALFFHTYLRAEGAEQAAARCRIGTLAWLEGWTLERKLDPDMGAACE